MRVCLVRSFGFPRVFGSKAELRQEEREGTQTLEGSVGRKMAATDKARPKCVTYLFCRSSLVCTQTLEGSVGGNWLPLEGTVSPDWLVLCPMAALWHKFLNLCVSLHDRGLNLWL